MPLTFRTMAAVIALLYWTTLANSAEPFAFDLDFPTVAKAGACGIAGCECGCLEGGVCTCAGHVTPASKWEKRGATWFHAGKATYRDSQGVWRYQPVARVEPVYRFQFRPMRSFGRSCGPYGCR